MANGFDLKIPAGRYKISGNWSLGAALGAAALRDCKGVTIHGDGPDTVIFSQALDGKGADVIQINSAKNLRIRHLALESVVVDFTGAGSNGISITNGFDNILIEDIFCKNLPYVDKTTYLDGGKAITVQSDVASTLNHGVLRVESLYALGCVYGFNVDATLDKWLGGTMSPSIIADVFADSCYSGIAISGFAVTPPFPDSSSCNVKIKATCKDCQTAITIVRFYGLSADVTILNTKTIANKRLNPDGGPWSTADNVVYGIYATSPINSLINVKGFIGECDYKITLGSVLDIKGDNNQILFDIGGTSLVSDIDPIIAGGNLLSNSMIEVSNATAASIPNDFYTPSYNNVLIYGTSNITSKSLVLRDFLGFSESDGVTCNYKLKRGDFSLAAQQTLGGTPTLRIFEYQNNAGTAVTAILNNGSLSTSALNTAATVATIKAVMVIYDLSGAIVGYVPVYTSYAT